MVAKRRILLALVLGSSLVLSACATTGGTEPEAIPQRTSLQDYLDQSVKWDSCDPEWLVDPEIATDVLADAVVECTSVFVPALYDGTFEAPDFSIALMRVRLVGNEEPVGAIFINPGGPGGSGIDQVQTSDFPRELLASFDLIGFDPRGVQHSTFSDGSTIKCSDELDFISYFQPSSPASEAELDALVVANDIYYQDCVEQNPYWWTLSTAGVVADLELLRQVITPDQPLNFLGSSYGTTIAGRYVSEYPDQVGKIVLDSPTTVDTDRIASYLTNQAAAETKLEIYVEGYAKHLGVSFEEAWQRVLEIRQRADDGLMVGYAGFEPSATVPNSMISSEALFTRGIFTLNYFPEAVAITTFIQGMDDAWEFNWNGTFEWLAFTLDGYDADTLGGASLAAKNIVRSNEFEIRVIVNTMDFSLPPFTEEEQRALSASLQEVAPLWSELSSDPSGYAYYGPPKGLSWYRLALDDPAIPTPPSTPFIPTNSSGKQLLVIGSLFESVTPFDFAKDTAALLGAALVTVDSDVHAPAARYDNACINEVLLAYFLGTQPVVDTRC